MSEVNNTQRPIFLDDFPAITTKPVEAYEGAKGRVHPTATKALDDKIMTDLAEGWLSTRDVGSKTNYPFVALVEDMEDNLEMYEKALKFARWRATMRKDGRL